VKRTWSPDELAAHWTLTDAERQLLPDCVDHNRLGFAAHLKFFGRIAMDPTSNRRHLPTAVVASRAWRACRPLRRTERRPVWGYSKQRG
jgi:hypothetical protein